MNVGELKRVLEQHPDHMDVALRVDCQGHEAHEVEGINQVQIESDHWVLIEG